LQKEKGKAKRLLLSASSVLSTTKLSKGEGGRKKEEKAPKKTQLFCLSITHGRKKRKEKKESPRKRGRAIYPF